MLWCSTVSSTPRPLSSRKEKEEEKEERGYGDKRRPSPAISRVRPLHTSSSRALQVPLYMYI